MQKELTTALCGFKRSIYFVTYSETEYSRSFRVDIGSIWFEFQTGTVHGISWIPRNINMDDVLTKVDSTTSDMCHLFLASGILQIDYKIQSESKSVKRIFG